METHYNNSLAEGEKDPKDVRSYRPVALINVFCKIFERISNKRIVWYLEKEKKIDDKTIRLQKTKKHNTRNIKNNKNS